MSFITYPFTFRTDVNPQILYTATGCDEYGSVRVTWVNDGISDSIGFRQEDAIKFLKDRKWIIVEETQPFDIRQALKLKIFAMRIAEVEGNLQALKREFEHLKGSI